MNSTILKYQNGNMDSFVMEIFYAIEYKECENCKFITDIYGQSSFFEKESETKIEVLKF